MQTSARKPHVCPRCPRKLPGEDLSPRVFSDNFVHVSGSGELINIYGEACMSGAKVHVVGMFVERDPVNAGRMTCYQSLEIEWCEKVIPATRKAGLDGQYPMSQDFTRKVVSLLED